MHIGLAIFCFSVLGGFIAGLLIHYIGGVGVTRQHTFRLDELEEGYENLSRRLKSEIARRSAEASLESRKRNESLKEEAERILQQKQSEDVVVQQSFGTYMK